MLGIYGTSLHQALRHAVSELGVLLPAPGLDRVFVDIDQQATPLDSACAALEACGLVASEIEPASVSRALGQGSALIGVDYRQFRSVFEQSAAIEIRSRLFDAVERGDLAPPVGTTFEFANYLDAMELAGSREGLGKAVISIGDGDEL